jgi:TolB-like protein/Flp pilus assembly protein TadD
MVEQDGPALAVLPLANVGDDPNLEYLSDGVTESIINSLACLPRLRVMARSTVFRYKGREADVRQVGRELNVRSVVSGRLRRFNGRLLLSVELVNIEDGSQLWGERYNYPFSDIFQVQEEIAREITGKLRISLTGEDRERLSRRNTGNSDAYHFYLKGRYFWNKRTVEEINHGMQCFNEAARIAPDFAPAHLGLADCYLSLAVWNALPSNESLPLAKAEAARALEFDETLAEAHAALAYIEMLMLNWPAVDARFRRALELNPNCAQAHSRYSIYLAITGRFDEAAAEAERALAADPLSPVMHTNASRVFLYARRYERAAAHCREALEIEPRFAAARGILGVIHGATGRYDEAIGEMREVLAPAPDDPEALSILGYLHAALGRRAEARALLRRVRRLSRRTYVSAFFMGWIYAGLGEKDRAFECLERAYEERAYILSHLPVIFYYDCLRDDARFADLLRRIGLPNG